MGISLHREVHYQLRLTSLTKLMDQQIILSNKTKRAFSSLSPGFITNQPEQSGITSNKRDLMKTTKIIQGKRIMMSSGHAEVEVIEIEINGGDQIFELYEHDGDLVIKKIDPDRPNQVPLERLHIMPSFRDKIRVR